MIDRMRHFLAVAEHGTFTAAAKHCGLSQAAMSASIHRLEEELGARLFNRGRQGAQLNAEGLAFKCHAQAALAAVDDGRRAIKSVLGLEVGSLRVAAGATACTYLLPKIIERFVSAHPGIRFQLREMTSAESLQALAAGEVDLAIVGHGLPASSAAKAPEIHVSPTLHSEPWIEENLLLVASPNLASKYAPMCRLDAEGAPFLAFRPGATTRTMLDRSFPDAQVVMELGSIAAIIGHARASIGFALLSENAVVDELRRGRLVEVQDSRMPLSRRLSLVHRGQDRLHPAARILCQMLLA